jgi:hypothetical protein
MPDTPPPSTRDQHAVIARKMIDLGYTSRDARLAELSRRVGRDIPVFAVLTKDEADAIITTLLTDQAARAQDATLASLRADGWAV